MTRRNPPWLRWLAALALCAPAVHADIDPPRPKDRPSPRLLPICVSVHERLCGLLDREGRWVVEPAYAELYPQDDGSWYATRRGGLEGVLDAQGKVRIEPRFQYIGPFVGGLARASYWVRDKDGYIDERGDWAIPGQYFLAGDFVDGVAVVGQWIGGPNDGHADMRYIDVQGRPAFPGTWTDAESFRYGMAVVGRGPTVRTDDNIAQAEAGLIDRQGRYLLPLGLRSALTPVAPERAIEQTATRYALLDSHGKVLFEVPLEGDLQDAGAGRLAYRRKEEGRYGLLDVHSGKVLVDAAHGWLGAPEFADGVAWVEQGETFGERRALIDRDGHALLANLAYDGVMDFASGAAAVSGRDGHGWQLIDRRGRAITAADYDSFSAAWEDGSQSARFGDVWVGQRGGRKTWIAADGHVIARVEPHACGIEVVYDAAGRAIWPRDVDAACAVYAEERPNTPAVTGVPPARLEAARLECAREVVQWLADLDRRDHEFRQDAAMAKPSRRQLLARAPWQRGPADIALGDGVSLALPAGYRYLAPAYAPAVITMVDGMLPPSPEGVPVALLANDDFSVVLRVAAAAPGHVRPPAAPLDAASLARRMKAGVTGFAGTPADDARHSVDWLMPPRWDDAAKRLDWTYADFVIRGSAFGRLHATNTLLFGRRQVVAMQGMTADLYGKHIALVAQNTLATLARGVRFAPGERYEDAKSDEPAAPLGVAGYITTAPEPPPEASAAASTQPADTDEAAETPAETDGPQPRRMIGIFIAVVVASLLLALWFSRRKP